MKRQKYGGRKAGTPNKMTAIREVAQSYGPEAVEILGAIMRNGQEPTASRVAAANALLDRGHGRPAQAITGAEGGPVAVSTTIMHVYETVADKETR